MGGVVVPGGTVGHIPGSSRTEGPWLEVSWVHLTAHWGTGYSPGAASPPLPAPCRQARRRPHSSPESAHLLPRQARLLAHSQKPLGNSLVVSPRLSTRKSTSRPACPDWQGQVPDVHCSTALSAPTVEGIHAWRTVRLWTVVRSAGERTCRDADDPHEAW